MPTALSFFFGNLNSLCFCYVFNLVSIWKNHALDSGFVCAPPHPNIPSDCSILTNFRWANANGLCWKLMHCSTIAEKWQNCSLWIAKFFVLAIKREIKKYDKYSEITPINRFYFYMLFFCFWSNGFIVSQQPQSSYVFIDNHKYSTGNVSLTSFNGLAALLFIDGNENI